MPHFILEMNTVVDPNWVPVSDFKSLNKVVTDSGKHIQSVDYGGHHYQIIRKEIYIFSQIERFFRKVIVVVALIFSAGLLLLHKPVRDLWFKNHLSRRYAKQLEGETDCERKNNTLYYKNPLLLSEGVGGRWRGKVYFAEVKRRGKSKFLLVQKEENGCEYTSYHADTEHFNELLFNAIRKSSDSILPLLSKLDKPCKFLNYLLWHFLDQKMRFLHLEKKHMVEIFQLFSDEISSFRFDRLMEIYNYAKLECEELVVAIEKKYPHLQKPQDPVKTLPTELMLHIFSYLKVASMEKVMLVNKEWNEKAFNIKYFKAGIYRKKAITANKWMNLTQTRFPLQEDKNAEFNSLPNETLEHFFLRNREEDCVLIRDLSSVCPIFQKTFEGIIPKIQNSEEIKWFILATNIYNYLFDLGKLKIAHPLASSLVPFNPIISEIDRGDPLLSVDFQNLSAFGENLTFAASNFDSSDLSWAAGFQTFES